MKIFPSPTRADVENNKSSGPYDRKDAIWAELEYNTSFKNGREISLRTKDELACLYLRHWR